jgi:hypothetical protein
MFIKSIVHTQPNYFPIVHTQPNYFPIDLKYDLVGFEPWSPLRESSY